MKNISKSNLIYKINLHNNYKNLWGVKYNTKYNLYLRKVININNCISIYLKYNNILDTKYLLFNNTFVLLNKLFWDKNTAKQLTRLYLIKLYLIYLNKLNFFVKKNYNIYFNFYILNFSFTSIKFLINYIKTEIKAQVPIRKILNYIAYKVLNIKYGNIKLFKGIKIIISGRINNSERAFSEKFIFGKLKLQTLTVPVLYEKDYLKTNYGLLGIKIWLVKTLFINENN